MSEIKGRDPSPLTHFNLWCIRSGFLPLSPVPTEYSFCFHHFVITFNAFLRRCSDFPRGSFFHVKMSSTSVFFSPFRFFLARGYPFSISLSVENEQRMGWSKQLNKNILIDQTVVEGIVRASLINQLTDVHNKTPSDNTMSWTQKDDYRDDNYLQCSWGKMQIHHRVQMIIIKWWKCHRKSSIVQTINAISKFSAFRILLQLCTLTSQLW